MPRAGQFTPILCRRCRRQRLGLYLIDVAVRSWDGPPVLYTGLRGIEMRRQVLGFALAALAVLSLLIAGACSTRFRLAVLNPQRIPTGIREKITLPPGDGGLAFHGLYEQEEYVVVAYSYTLSRVGLQAFAVEAFSVDPTSGAAKYLGGGRAGLSMNQYGWSDSRVRSGVATWEYAVGWAFSHDAHRVIVTTTRGRTVEAKIVDGFWLARIEVDPSGLELLQSIAVMDEAGGVLYTDRRH